MSLFRRKRMRNGKLVASGNWYTEFHDPLTQKTVRLNLGVPYKDAAMEKERQIKRERTEISLKMRPAPALTVNMRKPLTEHAQDYIRFLEGKERAAHYVYTVDYYLRIVFTDCGWKLASDATLDSYYEWRSAQTAKGKAAKTVREYQAAICTFFRWLKTLGRIPFNPLENVDRVTVDGRKKRVRRIVSAAEFQRLLDVAGERGLAYFIVVNLGLRRGDGDGLTWGDFIDLDGPNPCWISRAEVAKEPVENILPLKAEIVQALLEARPAHWQPNDKVFPKKLPSMDWVYKDFRAAGIKPINEKGERVDLHALRHTFCTHINSNGVPLVQAAKFMRHEDPKQTAKTYYRADLQNLTPALARVPVIGSLKKGTGKGTGNTVPHGTSQSRTVNFNHENTNAEPVEREGHSPTLAATGTDGPHFEKVHPAGLEPATF